MGNTIIVLLQILIPVLFIYVAAIGVLKMVVKCSVKEAREIIANFIKKHFIGNNNTMEYELRNDENYRRDVNTTCKDLLGEKRYNDLIMLTKYSSTIEFEESAGYPLVYITVNPIDENERIRIQNALLDTTKLYIENYGKNGLEVTAEWGENRKIRLPMLIIGYSRNETETAAIRRKEQSLAEKVIISANTEIYDEELL